MGRVSYARAYEEQVRQHERVLESRTSADERGAGVVLTVEHDPVITVSRRAGAGAHVLASTELLARAGVELAETDRGGDVTYHGPGQLVVYPILDLNKLKLGIHDYMRLLEQSVIDTCAGFGVAADRDPGATGVWVWADAESGRYVGVERENTVLAKVAAFGVRVRRWVAMHGLAINLTTNLDHFGLIVPCGLAGRPVTSLRALLGESCPAWSNVRAALLANLARLVAARGAAMAR